MDERSSVGLSARPGWHYGAMGAAVSLAQVLLIAALTRLNDTVVSLPGGGTSHMHRAPIALGWVFLVASFGLAGWIAWRTSPRWQWGLSAAVGVPLQYPILTLMMTGALSGTMVAMFAGLPYAVATITCIAGASLVGHLLRRRNRAR